jgi:hypothetical protein
MGGELDEAVLVTLDRPVQNQEMLQIDRLDFPRLNSCLRDRSGSQLDLLGELGFVFGRFSSGFVVRGRLCGRSSAPGDGEACEESGC